VKTLINIWGFYTSAASLKSFSAGNDVA